MPTACILARQKTPSYDFLIVGFHYIMQQKPSKIKDRTIKGAVRAFILKVQPSRDREGWTFPKKAFPLLWQKF